MSMLSDHEKIDGLLRSHERKWTLQAASHEEDAEKARSRKHEAMSAHVNAPDEARSRMSSMHDAEIRGHETKARVCRRRAEHAAAGYLLEGPDETRDADYQRDHADLVAMARRTGRLRASDESVA
jgi:hypothetical protein